MPRKLKKGMIVFTVMVFLSLMIANAATGREISDPMLVGNLAKDIGRLAEIVETEGNVILNITDSVQTLYYLKIFIFPENIEVLPGTEKSLKIVVESGGPIDVYDGFKHLLLKNGDEYERKYRAFSINIINIYELQSAVSPRILAPSIGLYDLTILRVTSEAITSYLQLDDEMVIRLPEILPTDNRDKQVIVEFDDDVSNPPPIFVIAGSRRVELSSDNRKEQFVYHGTGLTIITQPPIGREDSVSNVIATLMEERTQSKKFFLPLSFGAFYLASNPLPVITLPVNAPLGHRFGIALKGGGNVRVNTDTDLGYTDILDSNNYFFKKEQDGWVEKGSFNTSYWTIVPKTLKNSIMHQLKELSRLEKNIIWQYAGGEQDFPDSFFWAILPWNDNIVCYSENGTSCAWGKTTMTDEERRLAQTPAQYVNCSDLPQTPASNWCNKLKYFHPNRIAETLENSLARKTKHHQLLTAKINKKRTEDTSIIDSQKALLSARYGTLLHQVGSDLNVKKQADYGRMESMRLSFTSDFDEIYLAQRDQTQRLLDEALTKRDTIEVPDACSTYDLIIAAYVVPVAVVCVVKADKRKQRIQEIADINVAIEAYKAVIVSLREKRMANIARYFDAEKLKINAFYSRLLSRQQEYYTAQMKLVDSNQHPMLVKISAFLQAEMNVLAMISARHESELDELQDRINFLNTDDESKLALAKEQMEAADTLMSEEGGHALLAVVENKFPIVKGIKDFSDNPSNKNLFLMMGAALGGQPGAQITTLTTDMIDKFNSKEFKDLMKVFDSIGDDAALHQAINTAVVDLFHDIEPYVIATATKHNLYRPDPSQNIMDNAAPLLGTVNNLQSVKNRIASQALHNAFETYDGIPDGKLYDYLPYHTLRALVEAIINANAMSGRAGIRSPDQVYVNYKLALEEIELLMEPIYQLFDHAFGVKYAQVDQDRIIRVYNLNHSNSDLVGTHDTKHGGRQPYTGIPTNETDRLVKHFATLEMLSFFFFDITNTLPYKIEEKYIKGSAGAFLSSGNEYVVLLNKRIVEDTDSSWNIVSIYLEELGHLFSWIRCKINPALDANNSICDPVGDEGARFRDLVQHDDFVGEMNKSLTHYQSYVDRINANAEGHHHYTFNSVTVDSSQNHEVRFPTSTSSSGGTTRSVYLHFDSIPPDFPKTLRHSVSTLASSTFTAIRQRTFFENYNEKYHYNIHNIIAGLPSYSHSGHKMAINFKDASQGLLQYYSGINTVNDDVSVGDLYADIEVSGWIPSNFSSHLVTDFGVKMNLKLPKLAPEGKPGNTAYTHAEIEADSTKKNRPTMWLGLYFTDGVSLNLKTKGIPSSDGAAGLGVAATGAAGIGRWHGVRFPLQMDHNDEWQSLPDKRLYVKDIFGYITGSASIPGLSPSTYSAGKMSMAGAAGASFSVEPVLYPENFKEVLGLDLGTALVGCLVGATVGAVIGEGDIALGCEVGSQIGEGIADAIEATNNMCEVWGWAGPFLSLGMSFGSTSHSQKASILKEIPGHETPSVPVHQNPVYGGGNTGTPHPPNAPYMQPRTTHPSSTIPATLRTTRNINRVVNRRSYGGSIGGDVNVALKWSYTPYLQLHKKIKDMNTDTINDIAITEGAGIGVTQ